MFEFEILHPDMLAFGIEDSDFGVLVRECSCKGRVHCGT